MHGASGEKVGEGGADVVAVSAEQEGVLEAGGGARECSGGARAHRERPLPGFFTGGLAARVELAEGIGTGRGERKSFGARLGQ